jgi:CHAD domain-containing protein
MAFRLESSEDVAAEVRRVVSEQLETAIAHLEKEEGDRDKHVHEARKCLKRLRALALLVRGELGAELGRRENACFRDAARKLAGLREAAVLVETLDRLVEWEGGSATRRKFATMRRWLMERKEAAYAQAGSNGQATSQVAEELRQALKRVEGWPLQERGWKGIEPGLRRVYAQGRREFARARAEGSDEAFHEWRKWVKYLWYHAQLVRLVWPWAMAALIEELDELGERLGQDHDLTVLRQMVCGQMDRPVRPTTLQALVELIQARQGELRSQAQGTGRRIYAERPRDFMRRLRAYWRAWGAEEGGDAKEKESEQAVEAMRESIRSVNADLDGQKTEAGPVTQAAPESNVAADAANGRVTEPGQADVVPDGQETEGGQMAQAVSETGVAADAADGRVTEEWPKNRSCSGCA